MRTRLLILLLLLALPACAMDAPRAALPDSSVWPADTPRRPVATYSILVRDARTGEMGVAVQSH
ncbi:MAG: hypothetical protein VYC34_09375, partial [Planctomycetota bacterium]|nr:hypothetical protein [Planctomycetota bacterium]